VTFTQYTQRVMDSLSAEEQQAFQQLLDCDKFRRQLMVDNQLIKNNRNVAEWLAFYDGRLLEFVGQFRDDPKVVRKAMEDRDQSITYAGPEVLANREFLLAIMKEFPRAAYSTFMNTAAHLQVDPDVAQCYLEANLIALDTLNLRENEEVRRSAANYYPPDAETLIDKLLERYEFYTESFGTSGQEAFAMMRAERTSAMQNELTCFDLPLLD